MGDEKIHHDGQHMQPAEHDRRGERKLALRLGMLASKPQFRRLELVENATARFDVASALLGERKPARGACEQPHAKLLLERLEVPADGRERRAKAAACGGKTSRVGDSDEDAHGGQAVQFHSSEIRKYQLE
jgi:hypothetical protein